MAGLADMQKAFFDAKNPRQAGVARDNIVGNFERMCSENPELRAMQIDEIAQDLHSRINYETGSIAIPKK